MSEDSRCCGSGTCLINAAGVCWCGQRWNGDTMCSPGQTTGPVAQVDSVDAFKPSEKAQARARPGTGTPPTSAADA
jgi:hypothetical protein